METLFDHYLTKKIYMDAITNSGLDIWNIVLMVLVGAMAGSLAGFIIRGNNYGFIVNSVLGIFGAVIGGAIFNMLNITPGKGIVKMISDTFQVNLPLNFVGMIVSATLGAVIILLGLKLIRGGK